MISQEVRNALKNLTQQLLTIDKPDALAENTGDCWAELIGEIIEIARQNAMAECMKSAPKRRFLTKEEIILRAFRGLDFEPDDLGISEATARSIWTGLYPEERKP